MARLITGGSGFLGAELAHMMVKRGQEVVVFDKVKNNRLADIENRISFVRGDLSNWSEVLNVIKNNRITHIYHLGALLSYEAESNPWASIQANIIGGYNVLEAARLFNVERLAFTSTILTFDAGADSTFTDVTLQRPTTIYGVEKLFYEGMGRFYRKKFGLDFRSVRYPSVVGPGDTTPMHWPGPMIESAVLGKPFECPVTGDSTAPMIYYKDAALAVDMVLQAPEKGIKMVNYNVAGTTVVSAKELKQAIKKYIPEDDIRIPKVAAPHPLDFVKVWDDSYARQEWAWKPVYTTVNKLVSVFIRDMQSNPVAKLE
jgi:threonine 3-dehydrogenase